MHAHQIQKPLSTEDKARLMLNAIRLRAWDPASPGKKPKAIHKEDPETGKVRQVKVFDPAFPSDYERWTSDAQVS